MPGPSTPAARPLFQTEIEPRLAPMWRVLIHNDPVTPMHAVVQVLRETWKLEGASSEKIMYEAHFHGVALVCVEPREQAEFHVDQAHSLARGGGWPLSFSIEPET